MSAQEQQEEELEALGWVVTLLLSLNRILWTLKNMRYVLLTMSHNFFFAAISLILFI